MILYGLTGFGEKDITQNTIKLLLTIINNTMMKILEAHDALSAILVDKSDYDGIWLSSLCETAAKGIPDSELISFDTRLNTIREIRNVSDKPIIIDLDTGGATEHFPYKVRQLQKAGVQIIMIEDKIFPKKNSLLEGEKQPLENVDVFADKISKGKEVEGIQIFARLESLIAKKSIADALIRAEEYLRAGADGIMIHSKIQVDSTEIMEFATRFREIHPNTPLVAVPTTYNLPKKHPFDIVIYANHLLRASLKAMKETIALKDIKKADMADVTEIFELVGK